MKRFLDKIKKRIDENWDMTIEIESQRVGMSEIALKISKHFKGG